MLTQNAQSASQQRTIMTGLSPKNHGNREYCEKLEMPKVQTLAESFKKAGYQAFAVGKMHVYLQRNRIVLMI